jgi:hypothetical protein
MKMAICERATLQMAINHVKQMIKTDLPNVKYQRTSETVLPIILSTPLKKKT